MPDMQPPLPLDKPYTNRNLFSDYYLEHILPEQTHWQFLEAEAQIIWAQIQTLYKSYTPSSNEAATEDEWVRPVLKALGHCYNVQPALKTSDGTKKPDYVFYQDTQAAANAKDKTLDDHLPEQGGILIGDAKYWDRNLDMAIRVKNADALSNKNPAYQIFFYVQQSGVEWGLLTNGRLWRLVHTSSAHKLDCYYEVDLVDLVQSGNIPDFLFFYAFFRASAFDKNNSLGVSKILERSTEFALGIGEALKTQVYQALLHLAQGFLDFERNGLTTDAASLKEIYDNSLIVLYRLLFILYAEGRGLLPVTVNDSYRTEYGLYALKQEIAKKCDARQQILPDSSNYWVRLKQLFGYIDKGSPPLKIATFNGGLFDPEKHPFLEKYTVGDKHLIYAVDLLARAGRQFIDYRDLAVRHLGTIYEGLLEFHLSPNAPEPGWRLSLLNDKGERKATGSYYTPDYIVKYIVEKTIAPILEKAVEGKSEADTRTQAILDINVLDPAMGSGHFLVEATEYIARCLVNLTPIDDTIPDTTHDLTYWKRRVAQSCIYGVDLNPLAVELAKLSLWLTTVSANLPLSFLDHHLRPGNSLVGARLDELQLTGSPAKAKKGQTKAEKQEAAGQISMMSNDAFQQSVSVAVGNMWLIEANAAQSVSQVKEQEKLYGELRQTLTQKYGSLADLVTAAHFGVDVPSELWNPLTDFATGRNMTTLPAIASLLTQARTLAQERRFFHWELEFPEVFFDRHGRPLGSSAGFDAIIGNPPYISAPTMTQKMPETRKYLARTTALLTMKWDIYCAFLASNWHTLKIEGKLGVIIPNQFLYQDYAEPMRSLFVSNATLTEICDLGNTIVFEDASVMTCIICLRKSAPLPDHTINTTVSQAKKLSTLSDSMNYSVLQKLFAQIPNSIFRLSISSEIYKFIEKIANMSIELGILCYGSVGVVPHSEKLDAPKSDFIFKTQKNAKCKRYIEGKNMERYITKWDGNWLEYDYSIVRRPSLPELLETEKIILKLIAGKTGLNATYDAEGLYTDHSLVLFALKCQLTSVKTRNLKFSAEEIQLSAQYTLPYILALINSKLIGWYFKAFLGSDLNIGPEDAKRLPIRKITFVASDTVRQQLLSKGIELYRANKFEELMEFTRARLAVQPEQSDVVHDLLASLAQQMLDLNAVRHTAVENLLLDLEGVFTPAELAKIARLWTPLSAPKTGVADYDKRLREYETLLTASRNQLDTLTDRRLDLRTHIGAINETQWKWLLKFRLKTIRNLSDIVQVYRKSQPSIAALDKQIEDTDKLIDRIVYALYALTPDDIAAIERSTPSPDENAGANQGESE